MAMLKSKIQLCTLSGTPGMVLIFISSPRRVFSRLVPLNNFGYNNMTIISNFAIGVQ